MERGPASSSTKSVIADSSVESDFVKAFNTPPTPYRFRLCPRTVPYSQFPMGQYKPLFAASGDWKWLNTTDIEGLYENIISYNTYYTMAIRKGKAGDRVISYLIKSWRHSMSSDPSIRNPGMFTELYLYMTRFDEELLGTTVLKLIAVQRSPDALHFVMELPHHSFWIEASSDMPEVLKERVIQALKRIHEAGILLVDITLSNFIITGDGTVLVLNLHQARSDQPSHSPCVYLDLAQPYEFIEEMKLLQLRLDYQGIRHTLGHAKNLSKPPRLFIAPGQSKETFQRNLKCFMDTFLKSDNNSQQQTQAETPEHTGSDLLRPSSHVTPTEIQQPQSHHYNLRKRKQTSASDICPPNLPSKRARVLPQEISQKKPRKHDNKKSAASLVLKPGLDPSVQLNNITPGLPFIVVRDFVPKQRNESPRAPSFGHDPDEQSRPLEHYAGPSLLRERDSIWILLSASIQCVRLLSGLNSKIDEDRQRVAIACGVFISSQDQSSRLQFISESHNRRDILLYVSLGRVGSFPLRQFSAKYTTCAYLAFDSY